MRSPIRGNKSLWLVFSPRILRYTIAPQNLTSCITIFFEPFFFHPNPVLSLSLSLSLSTEPIYPWNLTELSPCSLPFFPSFFFFFLFSLDELCVRLIIPFVYYIHWFFTVEKCFHETGDSSSKRSVQQHVRLWVEYLNGHLMPPNIKFFYFGDILKLFIM